MDMSKLKNFAALAGSFFALAAPALAVPKLRLSNTVVGPVTVAQGQNATAPEVEAWGVTGERGLNTETSLLRLTFSSSAPWVSARVIAPRPCFGREGECLPIQLTFTTQSLQPGQYSATVTVSDPAAIDAPQNILVPLTVGSAFPDQVNFFVAPNGSTDTVTFQTNSNLALAPGTQTGGDWLSVVFRGIGTFAFVRPYQFGGRHLDGMAAGSYRGTVAIAGSRVPADNKTVNVTLNVTESPIAWPAQDAVRYRLHQGAAKAAGQILIRNRGTGTLAVSGATAATTGGGDWLAAETAEGNIVKVTVNPEGVQPGVYRGSVTVASNAANNDLRIPVELELLASRPAIIQFQGVQDTATFAEGDQLAAGGLVAAFGEGFTYSDAQESKDNPLPTNLGGTEVFVNDRPAPISFTSFGQVNFQIPYEIEPGEAVVRVDRDGTKGGPVSIIVRSAVPKVMRYALRARGLNIPEFRDYFAIAVNADGTLPLPREFGIPNSRPAKPGETITIFAQGLGPTSPQAVTGALPAGPPPPVASESKRICFGCLGLGGIFVDATAITLDPELVGVYRAVVKIPENAQIGDVAVRIVLDQASSDYGLIAVE